MKAPLALARERLAAARKAGEKHRYVVTAAGRADDFTRKALSYERELLDEGEIVLGMVVVATTHLFEQQIFDGSALVVYSHKPYVRRLPTEAAGMTNWLRAIREQRDQPHPELAALRDLLDGSDPLEATSIPKGMTAGLQFVVCTLPVFRYELPSRRLRAHVLPMLAHEDVPYVLPLPKALWPSELVEAWVDLGA